MMHSRVLLLPVRLCRVDVLSQTFFQGLRAESKAGASKRWTDLGELQLHSSCLQYSDFLHITLRDLDAASAFVAKGHSQRSAEPLSSRTWRCSLL